MTTELIILLAILGAVAIGLTALCWRMIGGLHGHHALDVKERERERRDHFQMMEKLLERRDTSQAQQLDLTHRHSAERMHRIATDAATEQQEAKANSKTPTQPLRKQKPVPQWDDTARALMGQ